MRKGNGKERLRLGHDAANSGWVSSQRADNAMDAVAGGDKRAFSRNPAVGASSQRSKQGGGGLIRKFKSLNGSFRKDSGEMMRENEFPSVLEESESSPSNPQSPNSTESFVSVEVRGILCGPVSLVWDGNFSCFATSWLC